MWNISGSVARITNMPTVIILAVANLRWLRAGLGKRHVAEIDAPKDDVQCVSWASAVGLPDNGKTGRKRQSW